ncbi:hypothetical protein [uncultured Nocardioides sp.]|uniref:hypothetical protein n=1 Tax=uncultured Nocardioides sp. TaxID=198441 RepID=UPI0030F55F5A
MIATSVEPVQTYRYRAMGFTDDITSCDLCGRDELKGTVRLVLTDPDGDTDGDVYAGVVCAAKANGCTAKVIRAEAKRTEDLATTIHRTWAEAHSKAREGYREDTRTRLGLPRNAFDLALPREERWPAWQAVQARVSADEEYQAQMSAWEAEHPEPVEGRPVVRLPRGA